MRIFDFVKHKYNEIRVIIDVFQVPNNDKQG